MRSLLLTGLAVCGCLDPQEPPRSHGIVSASAGPTNKLLLGWPADGAPSFDVRGELDISNRTFELAEVLALGPRQVHDDPPVLSRCSLGEDCAGLDAVPVGLTTGVLFGMQIDPGGDVPATLPGFEAEQTTTCFGDDVVAVWAEAPVMRDDIEWTTFEAELPEGLSLMRVVPCTRWDRCEICWTERSARYCLEPLSDEAVVLLRPW